jgi:hypothetical protein
MPDRRLMAASLPFIYEAAQAALRMEEHDG